MFLMSEHAYWVLEITTEEENGALNSIGICDQDNIVHNALNDMKAFEFDQISGFIFYG